MSDLRLIFAISDGIILGMSVFTALLVVVCYHPTVRKLLIKVSIKLSEELIKEMENEEEES